MKSKITLSLAVLFSICMLMNAKAQTPNAVPGKLVVNGWTKEMQKPLKNSDIILSAEGEQQNVYVQVEHAKTAANGSFRFELDLDTKYTIEIIRKGYTPKKVAFDTRVYGLTNTPPSFDFEVDMVPDRDGLKYINPVAQVNFNKAKKEFDYNLDYTKAEAK